ncbi:MAG TPA: exodeoxyribonuclease V subunit gamma, partial [Propionibacteriaceae bacterium]|nr:exodeoxyribonuclease V subunit gamma [Propionibacteriaceae bacterium]
MTVLSTLASVTAPTTPPPTVGVHLHVAPDHASLVKSVVAPLTAATDDPFHQVPVIVPGAAQRRHLSQAVAAEVGICAGLDFISLGVLRRRVHRELL